MFDDDIECPRCKTTKYRNPQLKLLANVCGHPHCEKCIELMFANGSAKCYQCPVILKRGGFKRQLFQDSRVEKDVQVRRDILRKFNKTQEAFPNLRAYNDYLEKLETVIFNLANDIDLDETNKLLDELRRPAADAVSHVKQVKKELPYYHEIKSLHEDGPEIPEIDDKFIRSFTIREIAGGFTAQLAISRAIGEALSNLYTRPIKR